MTASHTLLLLQKKQAVEQELLQEADVIWTAVCKTMDAQEKMAAAHTLPLPRARRITRRKIRKLL